MASQKKYYGSAQGSAFYGLAFLGVFIYYLQQATSFWTGVVGFFKAAVWPAFLLHKVYEFLKM